MKKHSPGILLVHEHKYFVAFLFITLIGCILILTLSAQVAPTGPAGLTGPFGRSSRPQGPTYPTRASNAIEGTWECANGEETMGLYRSEFLLPSWNANPPSTIFVGIYRIRKGGFDEEYFYPGKDPATTIATRPDHLTIHFANVPGGNSRLPNTDLDIAFDSAANLWKGTGTLCNSSGNILLESPHSDNSLVGDWRDFYDGPPSVPYGKPLWIGSDFHIRQTVNGGLIVWQDDLGGNAPKDAVSVSSYSMIWTMRMSTSWEIRNQPSSRVSIKYLPCASCNNYDYNFEGTISSSLPRLITGKWFEINHGNYAEYSTSFHRLN